jgi:hypothetical protein
MIYHFDTDLYDVLLNSRKNEIYEFL